MNHADKVLLLNIANRLTALSADMKRLALSDPDSVAIRAIGERVDDAEDLASTLYARELGVGADV